MNDPKKTEATNEELGLEQLEDAAGGATAIEYGLMAAAKPLVRKNQFTTGAGGDSFKTSGPGGTSFPKKNVGNKLSEEIPCWTEF